MKKRYDVIILGGGVVGCAVAWYLSHFECSILVLEKELDVCCGISKANTGIIHSRSYYTPETMKGELHLRSLPWFHQAQDELDFHLARTGALTVALSPDDLAYLRLLQERGQCPEAEILGPKDTQELEPNISENMVAAYYDPQTAVISPFRLTLALAEGAVLNGVDFVFNVPVIDFHSDDRGIGIETETETDYYVAHWVVNSTGFSAPALAEKCGDGVPPLQAYRGEYYVLDKETRGYVKHVLYPVPTSLSKGILVSPTPEGNILVGPNFEPVKPGDTSTTVQGLAEVKIGAQKLVHHLPFDRTIQIFAGIRSVLPERDFHIFFSHRFSNIVHLCGIESPGLTASFGIAEYVGELLEKRGLNLVHKAHFNLRKNAPIFSECSWEERERLITQDPDWGRLVCRCEEVTLAEVKRALFVPPSARTIDGLKRRTRVTAGRCQGSFCEMHLLSTMIALLGFSENDIRKSGIHSHCLVGETREERESYATRH